MPTPTYVALANITLGGNASTVTFSSIPSTYQDLVLVWSGTTTGSAAVRLNGDTGANYQQLFTQNASSYNENSASSILMSNFGWTGNPNMFICNIMDYSTTSKDTFILSRAGIQTSVTGLSVVMNAARWMNTGVVNTINIIMFSGSMSAGTQIALYGIGA